MQTGRGRHQVDRGAPRYARRHQSRARVSDRSQSRLSPNSGPGSPEPLCVERSLAATRGASGGRWLIARVPALDRWLDQAGVDAQGTKRRSGLNVSRQREQHIADLNHGCLRSSACAPAPSTLDAPSPGRLSVASRPDRRSALGQPCPRSVVVKCSRRAADAGVVCVSFPEFVRVAGSVRLAGFPGGSSPASFWSQIVRFARVRVQTDLPVPSGTRPLCRLWVPGRGRDPQRNNSHRAAGEPIASS